VPYIDGSVGYVNAAAGPLDSRDEVLPSTAHAARRSCQRARYAHPGHTGGDAGGVDAKVVGRRSSDPQWLRGRNSGFAFADAGKMPIHTETIMAQVTAARARGQTPLLHIAVETGDIDEAELTGAVLQRFGRAYLMPSLEEPEVYASLTGFGPDAFSAWWDRHEIGSRYPDADRCDLYTHFLDVCAAAALYPDESGDDAQAFLALAERIRQRGGDIVYSFGRGACAARAAASAAFATLLFSTG
jgi:hypothetical protein